MEKSRFTRGQALLFSFENRSNEIRTNEIRTNEIRTNEIRIRREPSVLSSA